MKIVKLITKATHQSIVEAMISIAIAHGLTITNVEDIMTDVIAYLKDNATLIKIELSWAPSSIKSLEELVRILGIANNN